MNAKKLLKRLIIGWLVVVVLLPFAALPLTAQDPLQVADAIVVIGGDHKPERIAHAVRLYNEGYAPLVIISAGTWVKEGNEWRREAVVMRQQALTLGLSDDAIHIEDTSINTYENAFYSREVCDELGIQSVLLVTSPYHSRRARHRFQEVFTPAISVSTQPAPLPFCTLCWLAYPDYRETVGYEYFNWLRLFLWV